jgi:hypothetical protein
MKKTQKYIAYVLLSLIGLGFLLMMAILIFQGTSNHFRSFTFSINAITGEPYAKGKLLKSWMDEGFRDGTFAEVIEIPLENIDEVQKALSDEARN